MIYDTHADENAIGLFEVRFINFGRHWWVIVLLNHVAKICIQLPLMRI